MSLTGQYALRLCAVYKSPKKALTYLYVPNKDDFSRVPEPLMQSFGTPSFSMMLPLKKGRKLAQVDIEKLWSSLTEKGFYLQLPPPQENLLKTHLEDLKRKSD